MTFITFLESILWVQTSFLAGLFPALLLFELKNYEEKEGITLLWVLVIEYLSFFGYFFITLFDKSNTILLSIMGIFLFLGILTTYKLFKIKNNE